MLVFGIVLFIGVVGIIYCAVAQLLFGIHRQDSSPTELASLYPRLRLALRLYIQPTMQPLDPYTEKPSCCLTIAFLCYIYKSTHTRSKDTYRRIIARVAGGLTLFHALPSKHSTQSSSAKERQRFKLTTGRCVEYSECHTLSNNQRWKGL